MKAIHHCAGAGAEDERAEADNKAQTVCGSEEGADALQESQEDTRPSDCAVYGVLQLRSSRLPSALEA